jgi:hypothetical protein
MTLNEEIFDLITRARAVSKGSMDPIWDAIWDGEAWLQGRPTMLDGTGLEIRDSLLGYVNAREAKP